jgi:hypothetical protein
VQQVAQNSSSNERSTCVYLLLSKYPTIIRITSSDLQAANNYLTFLVGPSFVCRLARYKR